MTNRPTLSLKLLGEGVQIEFRQLFRLLQDLFESVGRISFFLVVLERVDGHLARPLVRLVVDPRPVEDFDVDLNRGTRDQTDFFLANSSLLFARYWLAWLRSFFY